MAKKPTKKRLIGKLEEVANWLYKDQPFLMNLTTSVVAIIFLVMVKFALIGFQQKLYSGYFEYMVVALLISILILQIPFRVSGWGNISLIFVGIAGVGLLVYDTTSLLPFAGKMVGFFAGGHILFMMFNAGTNYVNNNRRTCELLLRKFFRKRKKNYQRRKQEKLKKK
jgi:hypothetical protein